MPTSTISLSCLLVNLVFIKSVIGMSKYARKFHPPPPQQRDRERLGAWAPGEPQAAEQKGRDPRRLGDGQPNKPKQQFLFSSPGFSVKHLKVDNRVSLQLEGTNFNQT